MKFKKGFSGNPAGKPKGANDKRTELRSLFQPHAPALVETAIKMALRGDPVALRLCLERLVAPYRATSETLAGEIKMTGSLTEQTQQIVKGIAEGNVSPDAGAALMAALVSSCKVKEIMDLEERIEKLEMEAQKNEQP